MCRFFFGRLLPVTLIALSVNACLTDRLFREAQKGASYTSKGSTRIVAAYRRPYRATVCLEQHIVDQIRHYVVDVPMPDDGRFYTTDRKDQQPVLRLSESSVREAQCKAEGRKMAVLEIAPSTPIMLPPGETEAIYAGYQQGRLVAAGYVSSRSFMQKYNSYVLDFTETRLYERDWGNRPLLILTPVAAAADVVGTTALLGAWMFVCSYPGTACDGWTAKEPDKEQDDR